MKKSGFTLVELLAVIIVLSLIAVIVVPNVTKTINESREETTILNAKKYVSAVELALTDRALENNTALTSCEVQSSGNLLCGTETIEIDVKGEKPTSGTLTISGYDVTKVKNLTYTSGKVSLSGSTYTYKKLNDDSNDAICTAVTSSDAGNVPEGNFEAGDEYICQVNDTQEFHFYVLSKDGDTVSLIMNQNIGYDGVLIPDLSGFTLSEMETKWATDPNSVGTTAWMSEADYIALGGTHEEYCSSTVKTIGNTSLCEGSNEYGPVTAFKYLAHATAGWTNIPNIEIDYDDETALSAFFDKYIDVMGATITEEEKTSFLSGAYGTIKTTDNTTKIILKDGITVTGTYENLKARLISASEVVPLIHIPSGTVNSYFSDSSGLPTAWEKWLMNYLGKETASESAFVQPTNFSKWTLGYWGMSSTLQSPWGFSVDYFWLIGDSAGYYNVGIRPVIELTTDMFE